LIRPGGESHHAGKKGKKKKTFKAARGVPPGKSKVSAGGDRVRWEKKKESDSEKKKKQKKFKAKKQGQKKGNKQLGRKTLDDRCRVGKKKEPPTQTGNRWVEGNESVHVKERRRGAVGEKGQKRRKYDKVRAKNQG